MTQEQQQHKKKIVFAPRASQRRRLVINSHFFFSSKFDLMWLSLASSPCGHLCVVSPKVTVSHNSHLPRQANCSSLPSFCFGKESECKLNRLKADLIDSECSLSASGRLTRRLQKKSPLLILQPRANQNLLEEGGALSGSWGGGRQD